MTASSVRDYRSVSVTTDSMQAFQVASSGVEVGVDAVNKAVTANAKASAIISYSSSTLDCDASSGNLVSRSGSDIAGGQVTLTLLNASQAQIKCNDSLAMASEVDSIKSAGKFSQASRAVQVALAAGMTYKDYTWGTSDPAAVTISGINYPICGLSSSANIDSAASAQRFCEERSAIYIIGSTRDVKVCPAGVCATNVGTGGKCAFYSTDYAGWYTATGITYKHSIRCIK